MAPECTSRIKIPCSETFPRSLRSLAIAGFGDATAGQMTFFLFPLVVFDEMFYGNKWLREASRMMAFKDRSIPLYYQLENVLREKIRLGEYAEGDPFPTEEQLVREYGVSRLEEFGSVMTEVSSMRVGPPLDVRTL